jgi:hypothetical protein
MVADTYSASGTLIKEHGPRSSGRYGPPVSMDRLFLLWISILVIVASHLVQGKCETTRKINAKSSKSTVWPLPCYAASTSRLHLSSSSLPSHRSIDKPNVVSKVGLSRPSRHSHRLQALMQLEGGFASTLTTVTYLQDITVSTIVLGETLVWLKLWTQLAKKGLIESTLTRKIIHSSCVPLFILHWPLYSQSSTAALFAALIPLLQMVR